MRGEWQATILLIELDGGLYLSLLTIHSSLFHLVGRADSNCRPLAPKARAHRCSQRRRGSTGASLEARKPVAAGMYGSKVELPALIARAPYSMAKLFLVRSRQPEHDQFC